MTIVIDGTTGISGVDGTASNPSYEGTDTNTGVFFPAADTVAIGTGGTERLRVDSAGNAGLGVTPSAWGLSGVAALQIKNAGYWGYLNRAYMSANMFIDSGGSTKYIASDFATYYVQLNGGHNWLTAPSGTAGNAITFTQAMTLDASGNLGIGTTSPHFKFSVAGGRLGGQTTDFVSTTTGTAYSWGTAATTGNTYANFGVGITGNSAYGNASMFPDGGHAQGMLWLGYTSSNGNYKLQVNGQIFATSATIATSDGRYKENVNAISGALDMVRSLNPVTFTWKTNLGGIENPDYDGTLQTEKWLRQPHDFPEGTQVGFIAQEVQEALKDQPFVNNLIRTNVRDAIKDSQGNVIYAEEEFFGIAEGNMIPLLTKAIQEQQAMIDEMKAEIASLKAQP